MFVENECTSTIVTGTGGVTGGVFGDVNQVYCDPGHVTTDGEESYLASCQASSVWAPLNPCYSKR